MPKATTPTSLRQNRRHNPLEDDIVASGGKLRTKGKKSRSKSGDLDDEKEEHFVDSKASRKILQHGRELATEDGPDSASAVTGQNEGNGFGGLDARLLNAEEDAEDDGEFGAQEEWGSDEEVGEDVDIEPADLDTFRKFLPTDEDPILKHGWDGAKEQENDEEQENGEGINLADIIMSKISAYEAKEACEDGNGVGPVDEDYELPPKVIEVYTKIGFILSRFKSGKLPKPFKILPTIPHWEDIIQYTNPTEWTPNACYEATRIFVSSKPIVAQHFLEMVLLDRVRDDIHETKKVNVHLFNALKKALYKPQAFFKGFLFPLVASGTCTLREAHIVSGALVRKSIPVLHSAAAIFHLCNIAAQEASAGTEGGGGPTTYFIKTLLEKRYALPYQVIDTLVFHFLRFRATDPVSVREGDAMMDAGTFGERQNKLPVIWHQCLLLFAQRYKHEITEDQREALLDLLLTHGHHSIGPEVRRELLAGRGRGVPLEPQGPALDGDDTMLIDG